MINSFKNALTYWIVLGRDFSGEDFVVWSILSSLMIALAIGFGFLVWFFPIAALIVFAIVFLPLFVQIYIKFTDLKIDEKIEKLSKLVAENKKYRKYY